MRRREVEGENIIAFFGVSRQCSGRSMAYFVEEDIFWLGVCSLHDTQVA